MENWREYEVALRDRGSLTVRVTPEAIAAWHPARHARLLKARLKPPVGPPLAPRSQVVHQRHSKLKAFLRKIAERTVAGLLAALEACADIFKPAECDLFASDRPLKLITT